MSIKAIVFDFAGVIELNDSGNPMIAIAKAVGVPLEDFKKEYFKYNHLSNVENMRWEDMILKVAGVFGVVTKEIQNEIAEIIKAVYAKRIINTELTDMLPRLRQQGLKTAIFSNNTTELRERLIETGIINLFDEVIISAEIGFQKPHKEAFEILFEKLKVKPEEVVFIDDTPKSLEKADEIGYTPILFTTNKKLRANLQELRIKV
jgi:putative hydrolase of the HAD superfamily